MTRQDFYAGLTIVAGLCALIAAIKLAASDGEAWERFRLERHCTEVDRQHPPAGIETVPGKTTWQCDDGSTYVRNGD